MRVLAYVLWILAGAWILLVVFGAAEFQDMYGGTSGLQFFGLAAAVALIPIVLGWWAYRRSQDGARDDRS